MDDFFQILIYIFIIVSFLSSIFRKKQKPQDKENNQTFKPSPQPKLETKSSQQEEYNILKEIEKMFKTDMPIPVPEKKEATFEGKKIESEHSETKDWQQPIEQEHRVTISEHTFENWDEKKRIAEEKRKAVNEKIIKQAEMFEKSLARTIEGKSDIKKNIIQRFKDPATLKEYIIISEIIGKPKALQE